MKEKLIAWFLLLMVIWFIFKAWFLPGTITGGDLSYFHTSMLSEYYLYPFAWNYQLQNGLGGFASPLGWISFTFSLPVALMTTVLSDWEIIEKIGFLSPFLLFSIFSSWYTFKVLFPNNKFFIVATFLYTCNTYVLMMVGGGQIVGIGAAYAIAPLVLIQFIKLSNLYTIHGENLRNTMLVKYSLYASIFFSLQVLFDIRIAYITYAAFILYFFLQIFKKSNVSRVLNLIFYTFVVPLCSVLLLHAFWILPTAIFGQNSLQDLGAAYNSTQAVKYFSFARLENTIALLHPNWPNNIFGQVDFMKPEFLLLPILAYTSLLFISNKQKTEKNYVLYFALLGLIGAFLAKGANEPFGGVYLWLFDTVPGFVMFRDPTKWYTLVAISYSMLIPYSVWNVYKLLKEHKKISLLHFKFPDKSILFNSHNVFLLFIILLLLVLIRPALSGNISGTLKLSQLPSEYNQLEDYLAQKQEFYRTFWIPARQSYTYSSNNHPAVSAQDLYTPSDSTNLAEMLKRKESKKMLQEAGIKYVIVPSDTEKRIYITDRKYDERIYQNVVSTLDTIKWLKKIKTFGKIIVYEVSDSKDRFWSSDSSLKITYDAISPVQYNLRVDNADKGDIVIFSESFHPQWRAEINRINVTTEKYSRYNSFVLPKDGSYSFKVYYTSQVWVDRGIIISLISLTVIICMLIFIRKR